MADKKDTQGLDRRLADIEALINRRFDEISSEIYATTEQVDMAEKGIIRRFTEIFEVLNAISYKGDGSTAANSGAELDAVVDMTEEAANRILDAAGRITNLTRKETIWDHPDKRNQALDLIQQETEEIFMACSFQDLTGQRIRQTLKNINNIEDRLGKALDKLGIHIDENANSLVEKEKNSASQEDIDTIFAQQRPQKTAKKS